MTYKEFYKRFGGSYRTMHITVIPKKPIERAKWLLNFLRGKHNIVDIDRRFFTLPRKSAIPKEFIRLDPWEGEYLFMMAARARHCIVEIGRFFGGSTFLLASANSEVSVYSVDLAPKDDEKLGQLLKQHDLGKNVNLIVGDAQRDSFSQISDIDLLFIDGDHSYQGCTNDLEKWYPKVRPAGHILLHDSYFGSEVQSSVADFIGEKDLQIVVPPFTSPNHWHSSTGSLTHFIKKKR